VIYTPTMSAQTDERELLIAKSKLAEQSERYDDMSKCMKEVVEKHTSTDRDLSTEVG